MLAVVLLRPVFFVADALVRNHALTPNLVDLVRWQSHWHVIRQSWTFFQNDFAGRIGTKVMQAGEAIEMTVNLTIDAVWYAAVFVIVAAIALAGMDPTAPRARSSSGSSPTASSSAGRCRTSTASPRRSPRPAR